MMDPYTSSSYESHRLYDNRHYEEGNRGSCDVMEGRLPGNLGSLTLKVLLSREETRYLFGFDITLINQLRQQTGANINLTEDDTPDRVLLLNGTLELIFKAFSLICRKLWDFLSGPCRSTPSVLSIRLAVPASQCGSIIGKQGAKVKEIRDITGSNIQVSQESLPDSTERCVEISGSGEACLQTTYHICCILQDAPIRGDIVPYVPKLSRSSSTISQNMSTAPPPPTSWPKEIRRSTEDWKPVFLCQDKAYIIEEGLGKLAPPELLRKELGQSSMSFVSEMTQGEHSSSSMSNPSELMASNSVSSQNGVLGKETPLRQEMTVSAEMIGSIIGKGGQKVAEIRRMSGAQIHIDQEEEPLDGQRVIKISGSEESILLATFLISSTIELLNRERISELNCRSNVSSQSSGLTGEEMNSEVIANSYHRSRGGFRSMARQNGGRMNGRRSPLGRLGGRRRGRR